LVSSWSKIRLAWPLAGGVAVALADAPGAVAVADDVVDGVVVAADDGVVDVAVDVLDEGAAADGVAVAADDDEGVVDVSACANCMSRVDDAHCMIGGGAGGACDTGGGGREQHREPDLETDIHHGLLDRSDSGWKRRMTRSPLQGSCRPNALILMGPGASAGRRDRQRM
jgi:hypothetical protein